MNNKLVPGILLGALVGGAITLANKNTRNALKSSIQNLKEGKRSDRGPSKISVIKEEVLYWKDAIEEIRRNNPELERALKNAKNTLQERKQNDKHLN
ncbi:YtxH domain-containing protein [Staphylococcus simulans]|uniref:YtxH domain-containing protein n=1 Tax=Staphylococcus simulans TaxID=1286 RepID=UPI0021D3C6A9|nr:YtxH domain-containing protein [Staphylococcus simulans]UXV38464.1 YtxH domain-containing protein [Staphylococcus simulans]UXV40912.1 YtxH domain-containing protein [Staphylococcus simulans]